MSTLRNAGCDKNVPAGGRGGVILYETQDDVGHLALPVLASRS